MMAVSVKMKGNGNIGYCFLAGSLLISALICVPALAASISWTSATDHAAFSPRHFHDAVTFDNKVWVIGGLDDANRYYNDVWYSGDGVTWTRATGSAPFSARYGHTVVAFNNKIWVIGGYDGHFKNDIWSSADGITWNQVIPSSVFSPRDHHTSVVFDNRIWVIGGEVSEYPWTYVNDVWSSVDGITWVQTTSHANFSERMGHTSTVYNNEIWTLSGVGDAYGNVRYNDVWHSSDGIIWTMATDSAQFSPRYYSDSVVMDNRMWLIAGADGKKRNDLWYSTDGSSWIQEMTADTLPARALHSAVVHNSKIWVTGGIVNSSSVNDVWYTNDSPVPATQVTTASQTTVATTVPTPAVNYTIPVVTGKIEGNKILLTWDLIPNQQLQGYKVVISKNKQNPRYPDDGYMFWITNRDQNSVMFDESNPYYGGDIGGHLIRGQKYYLSITAIYSDRNLPGNTIEMILPISTTPLPIVTSTQTPYETHITSQVTTIQTKPITTITVLPTTSPVTALATESVNDLLKEQNRKLEEQKKLLEEQNQKIEEQNKKLEDQNNILTQILTAIEHLFGIKTS